MEEHKTMPTNTPKQERDPSGKGSNTAPCSSPFPEDPREEDTFLVTEPIDGDFGDFIQDAKSKGWKWVTHSTRGIRFMYAPRDL